MKKNTDKWITQTRIGKRFGLTGIQVGRILTENGYRNSETLKPTVKANGWFRKVVMSGKPRREYYMWRTFYVTGLLTSLGFISVKSVRNAETGNGKT